MAGGVYFEKLLHLIESNSNLIRAVVRDDPSKIGQNINTLQAFLEDYSGKSHRPDDDVAEMLVKKIRDLPSGAEIDIEAFINSATQYKRGRFPKRLPDTVARLALNVRTTLKDIGIFAEMVQKFYQNKEELDVEFLKSKLPDRSPTEADLILEEDNVVGFGDALEEVLSLLTAESEEVQVIAIVGMHGIGKTTLAKRVLNLPLVKQEFYPRAFVHFSREYNRREVFLKILGAFSRIRDEINMMSLDKLAETIRRNLQERKYLIILDDIWTPEVWEDLESALPKKKQGKILITTRYRDVAPLANPRCVIYSLRCMVTSECRELFRRRVFGDTSCPVELIDYETRILERCTGLPLAVEVIANTLANHQEDTDWWSKAAGYLGNVYDVQDQVMRLSFNDLPDYLKPCFLYLSVFPENFEIPVWKLLLLWIAEGFVEPDGNMTLEDAAVAYLEDLVDRNLVIVEKRRLNGQIRTCRIPVIFREFCKEEAMKGKFSSEINRFEFIATSSGSPSLLYNYRRLCIHSSISNFLSSKPSGVHVWSLLGFTQEEMNFPQDYVSYIPKGFKFLRVLDIVRSITLTSFPAELFRLILLKYIAISCHLAVLPGKMSNLQCLQTIIIETSSPTLEVKADIWKMTQLRHIYTNAQTYLPKVMGEPSAQNLQTLARVSPESCTTEMFERTRNLKKLALSGDLSTVMEANGESSLLGSLVKLESLLNLKLLNDKLVPTLPAFPHEIIFPRRLKRLTLLNNLLDWKYMSTLGKLENLEVLKLKDNAFQGEFWQTEDGGFRRLKVLHIGSTNLVVWKASASNFPLLSSLFIRNCNKLDGIPLGLGNIPSLQNIDIYQTNGKVAFSAKKIEMLKLQVQKQRWKGGFNLSIYPPEN